MKTNRLLVFLFLAIVGCQKPQRPKVEPKYKVHLEMSPTMKEVVMQLVWLKSDPNVFMIKEVDPFRKNQ